MGAKYLETQFENTCHRKEEGSRSHTKQDCIGVQFLQTKLTTLESS